MDFTVFLLTSKSSLTLGGNFMQSMFAVAVSSYLNDYAMLRCRSICTPLQKSRRSFLCHWNVRTNLLLVLSPQPMNIHARNFQQKMYSILSEISKESSLILECTLNGYEFVEIGDHPLLHTTFTRCHQVWITTKPQKSFQQSNEERAKMLMYPHRYVFVCFDSIYWLMNLMQCTLAQHA